MLDERTAPAPIAFAELAAEEFEGVVVLDAREAQDFAAAHLRGSINIGLEGRFAEYAGTVLLPEQRIVVLTPPGRELEAKIRLGRIGFDNVVGFLADPMTAFAEHPDVLEHSSRLTATELMERRNQIADLVVLDVRNPRELADGAIPGALNVPLASLLQRIDELDRARPTVVYCASGYRSMIAASRLSAADFRRCLRPSRRIRRLGRRLTVAGVTPGCGTMRR